MKNKLRFGCELNGLLGRRTDIESRRCRRMSNPSNGSEHVSLILSIIGWKSKYIGKLSERA